MARLRNRDVALATWCGMLPDADGLGLVVDIANRVMGRPGHWYYGQYHHAVLHGLFGALVIPLALCVLATNRLRLFVVGFFAVHLHLLCDAVGSRGPGAEDFWPIPYLAVLQALDHSVGRPVAAGCLAELRSHGCSALLRICSSDTVGLFARGHVQCTGRSCVRLHRQESLASRQAGRFPAGFTGAIVGRVSFLSRTIKRIKAMTMTTSPTTTASVKLSIVFKYYPIWEAPGRRDLARSAVLPSVEQRRCPDPAP